LADLRSFVAEVKARPRAGLNPLPEVTPVETFIYLAGDRRAPFTSPLDDLELPQPPSPGIRPDKRRRKEELEAFPLDSLSMVGTLDKDETRWGLVRNSEGLIYRVKTGNYMGQNDGQITAITDVEIKLTEIILDGQSGYVEREASVALAE
jgi:type IV pilus assembly protein PilP